MQQIRTFKKFELDIETKRSQLSTVRLDASSLEAIKQLKGNVFNEQFEETFRSLSRNKAISLESDAFPFFFDDELT